MGILSRRKGVGFEREVVNFLQGHGLSAERVPLSGQLPNHRGDVSCPVRGVDRRFELKRRARGFKALYDGLGDGIYGLIVRDDSSKALVVLRLDSFAALLK